MSQAHVRVSAVVAGLLLAGLGTTAAAKTVSYSDIPSQSPMTTGVTVTQQADSPILAKATPNITGPAELPREQRGLPGR